MSCVIFFQPVTFGGRHRSCFLPFLCHHQWQTLSFLKRSDEFSMQSLYSRSLEIKGNASGVKSWASVTSWHVTLIIHSEDILFSSALALFRLEKQSWWVQRYRKVLWRNPNPWSYSGWVEGLVLNLSPIELSKSTWWSCQCLWSPHLGSKCQELPRWSEGCRAPFLLIHPLAPSRRRLPWEIFV